MIARLASIALFSLPLLVAAGGNCNTENQQCCNDVQNNLDQYALGQLALVGINVEDVTGMVGLTCTPVSVLAASGQSCNQQTVCCSNNNFAGVVAVGCTPINVNV
ncbi:hypothetical protein AMATHDRAFT_147596 [Amanita thiersii Skay4041]|uniref:Hydrophobin n=1 Tax=Amanita thiersii Skay4041 TaxID=703135 RepID=A0A2A9NHF1_9AGAR|nr:hypothetical protein AMATHDRAFT_147596 [Amanita thiersii Skay4041]